MKVFHNGDYAASPHSFETTRKALFVADRVRHIAEITDPATVVDKTTVEQIIERIHDPEYIDALKTGKGSRYLAESSGFGWGDRTWDFAVAHSHGVVAAVASVVAGDRRSGTLSSGLHHAAPDGGSGFCTINGLAVGAAYALTYLPEKRKVMILDFDAHCGGGTFAHIEQMEKMGIASSGDIIQIDFSTSPFDIYTPKHPHHLQIGRVRPRGDSDYQAGIIEMLQVAEERYEDGMIVLYNAGVDPVNVTTYTNPVGVIGDREAAVSQWIADKPAVFTLAGGYKWGGLTMENIADLHALNIEQWAQYRQYGEEAA